MAPVDDYPGVHYDVNIMSELQGEYQASHEPSVAAGEIGAPNEKIAYHLLLRSLARSALSVLKERNEPVGAFELLRQVAAAHGVTQHDAANAVARLNRVVKLDDSEPGELKFVVVEKEA